MLMHEAMAIIRGLEKPKGYMVHFEHLSGGHGCSVGLLSDWFPDKHAGEPLISTEEEAWALAEQFGRRTVGRCVNIYVIKDDFTPVVAYAQKKINSRGLEPL